MRKTVRFLMMGLIIVSLGLALVSCTPAAPAPTQPPAVEPTAAAQPTAVPAEPTAVPAEPTAVPAEPVTLTLWYISSNPEETEMITSQTKKFSELHPNVTVEVSFYSNLDEFVKTTKLAMNSGSGPDLFFGDQGVNFGPALAKAGMVMDLTDAIEKYGWKERFGTPLPWSWYWDAQTPGHFYGICPDFTTVGVFYNDAVFTELGLERPETFADFENILAVIKKKPDMAPISVGAGDGWPLEHVYEQIVHTTVPYEELTKFALFPVLGGDWDMPGTTEAATIIQDWATKGYFAENFLATSNDDATSMFMTGKSALLIAGTWNSGPISNVTEFPVRFFGMPPVHPDLNQDGSIHLGGFSINNPYYVNAATEYPDLALDLLDYLMGKETAIAQWNIGGTVAYTFAEGEQPAPVFPFQSDIYDAMHAFKGGFYLDNPIYAAQDYGNLQALVAGNITPEEYTKVKAELYARALSESKP